MKKKMLDLAERLLDLIYSNKFTNTLSTIKDEELPFDFNSFYEDSEDWPLSIWITQKLIGSPKIIHYQSDMLNLKHLLRIFKNDINQIDSINFEKIDDSHYKEIENDIKNLEKKYLDQYLHLNKKVDWKQDSLLISKIFNWLNNDLKIIQKNKYDVFSIWYIKFYEKDGKIKKIAYGKNFKELIETVENVRRIINYPKDKKTYKNPARNSILGILYALSKVYKGESKIYLNNEFHKNFDYYIKNSEFIDNNSEGSKKSFSSDDISQVRNVLAWKKRWISILEKKRWRGEKNAKKDDNYFLVKICS